MRSKFHLVTAAGTVIAISAAAGITGGCSGRPALIPNPDKNLRKASAQFAADAAVRHPYKAEAPRGGEAIARSQVGYSLDRLDLVNLSQDAWTDVEIWVNEKYVVFVPTMKPNELKVLNFQMLFNEKGDYFPVNNKSVRINRVEAYRDGQMWDIPVALAD